MYFPNAAEPRKYFSILQNFKSDSTSRLRKRVLCREKYKRQCSVVVISGLKRSPGLYSNTFYVLIGPIAIGYYNGKEKVVR